MTQSSTKLPGQDQSTWMKKILSRMRQLPQRSLTRMLKKQDYVKTFNVLTRSEHG